MTEKQMDRYFKDMFSYNYGGYSKISGHLIYTEEYDSSFHVLRKITQAELTERLIKKSREDAKLSGKIGQQLATLKTLGIVLGDGGVLTFESGE